MARLCERPGCSEHGAIAYGFDAVRALVWLAPLDPDADRNRAGTLCVRHADSMVVPLGWTLEDARDPMPRLFRSTARALAPLAQPSKPARSAPPKSARTRQAKPAKSARRTEPVRPTGAPAKRPDKATSQPQLPFEAPSKRGSTRRNPAPATAPTVVEVTGVASAPDDPDATVAIPWMPEFDITDDLGGALHADSPLLARAFRGVDRHP